jgi:hypothetical protein
LPLLGWLVHDCVSDFERTLGSTHKFDDKSIWGSSQTEIGGDNPCSRQLFLTSESRLENTQRRPALENDSGEKSQRRLK